MRSIYALIYNLTYIWGSYLWLSCLVPSRLLTAPSSVPWFTSKYVLPWKYKNTRNSCSNIFIFIVLGALKSLFCFPLDIDVNDILNCRTNYLLRKCRKKAIASKNDSLNTRLLIVTFHEIAIKYESDLKNSVRFIRYFYER